MNEFVTVSSSSYDPASLATKLTEKAAEGWSVVAIVPTGGDVTAFLSRASGATDAPADVAAVEPAAEPAETELVTMAPATAAAAAVAAEPVTEPAGWASAPDEAVAAPPTETAAAETAPADVAPAVAAHEPQPVAAAPTPAVPAGWYADPAGRFELRYWDGGTWTEHVSRAGQQFTDPPVA